MDEKCIYIFIHLFFSYSSLLNVYLYRQKITEFESEQTDYGQTNCLPKFGGINYTVSFHKIELLLIYIKLLRHTCM